MTYGRKTGFVCVATLLSLLSRISADSEGEGRPEERQGKLNRYDGVGIQVISRPTPVFRGRRPRILHTMGRERPDLMADIATSYDQYVRTAGQVYVLRRYTRVSAAVKRELGRVARRYARKGIKAIFRAGSAMDLWEYREHMRMISKISGGQDPFQRFQYNGTDPMFSSRYDPEWDDMNLIAWGPLRVTDFGDTDFDLDPSDLTKLWDVDLEDIVVAPSAPVEKPPLRVGQRVRFHTRLNLRISTSRIARTFYEAPAHQWFDRLVDTARYARFRLRVDFYTDILRRRYLASDLELKVWPDGRWATFLNVVF